MLDTIITFGEEMDEEDLKLTGLPLAFIYPNPVTSILNINLENITGEVNILLADIIGKTVKEYKIENATDKILLDISNLPSGMYIYKITDAGSLITTGKISKL
jgi:hypothetical protein